jgi:uncharacterized protein YegL
MKTYAAQLVLRLKAEAYGQEAMKVAVVMFGNGKLDSDYIVSDAIVASTFSSDMDQTAKAIEGLQWQRGFTNMAQAEMKARTLLQGNTRNSAQSVVLLITDGRPSFKLQTKKAAVDLRESARLVIAHVQEFRKEDTTELLEKTLASEPEKANYLHIPGKKHLKADYNTWVTKTLVELCPKAESPSKRLAEDQARGFKLLFEAVICATDSGIIAPASAMIADSPESCYEYAEDHVQFYHQFAYGIGGRCVVYKQPCSERSGKEGINIFEPIEKKIDNYLAPPPTPAPKEGFGWDDWA